MRIKLSCLLLLLACQSKGQVPDSSGTSQRYIIKMSKTFDVRRRVVEHFAWADTFTAHNDSLACIMAFGKLNRASNEYRLEWKERKYKRKRWPYDLKWEFIKEDGTIPTCKHPIYRVRGDLQMRVTTRCLND